MFERQKVDKKSKPARKLKHTNFVLILNISAKYNQNRSL